MSVMLAAWTLWNPLMMPIGLAAVLGVLLALDLYARVFWHLGYRRGHHDATAADLMKMTRIVEQGERKLREARGYYVDVPAKE